MQELICVSEGLQHNTSLVYLNLRNTQITDKGAEYISQALEFNISLQTLDISMYRITGYGYINKSLEINTTSSLNRSIK